MLKAMDIQIDAICPHTPIMPVTKTQVSLASHMRKQHNKVHRRNTILKVNKEEKEMEWKTTKRLRHIKMLTNIAWWHQTIY